MGPTNNGKSDYINLDETPGKCYVGDILFRCWIFIRWILESVKNSLENKFFQLIGFCRRKLATVKNWLGNKFFEPLGISRQKLATDLYYCQKDLSDNEFENFCGRFLQDISLKKLNVDEPAVGRIFLVLELPTKNRQNNVDVLCDDIKHVTEKYSLEGKDDIILIQISFDGNNIENPPNLMTEDTFDSIKIRLKRNFAWYINIVYTGKHDFQDCDINRDAADKLKSLSKKEK